MSELTVVGRLQRRTAGRRPRNVEPSPPPAPPPKPSGPTRLARMLALAYLIEQRIEEGVLRDYAHAARALRVTRARMSQIADLHLLPLEIQEDILLGRTMATERHLRANARTKPG